MNDYTLTKQEMQALLQFAEQIKQEVLREMENARIFRRKRKLTDYCLLFEALYHYLFDISSFRKLSVYMACQYEIHLSPTAWKKQCYKAIPILRIVVEKSMNKLLKTDSTVQSPVYALDATSFSAHGASGTSTRVHSMISLNDQISRFHCVTDAHTAEGTRHFPVIPGALYIGDRAYGKAVHAARMIDNKANILFRFTPFHLKLYKDSNCSLRLDIDALLASCTTFSVNCYIKGKERGYPVRIVGQMLSDEAQRTAKRKILRNAVKDQRSLRPKTIEYSKWLLLLTTIRRVHTKTLCNLYRKRWQIELYFKRAKTELHFHKLRRGSDRYYLLMTQLWSVVVLLFSLCQYSFYADTTHDFSLDYFFFVLSHLWA